MTNKQQQQQYPHEIRKGKLYHRGEVDSIWRVIEFVTNGTTEYWTYRDQYNNVCTELRNNVRKTRMRLN